MGRSITITLTLFLLEEKGVMRDMFGFEEGVVVERVEIKH